MQHGDTATARPSILPIGSVTFVVTDLAVDVFESAHDAVAAALDARRGAPGARIALHTGEAHVRDDGGYTGPARRRCERLREIANPGQTLLSAPAATAVGEMLASGAVLLDLGPHRLRDLSTPVRVFELRGSDIQAEADAGSAGLRSLDTVANNLPVQLTSFVGRSTELDAVQALLADHRMVTLTGTGGCGKTRLAAQVAADAAERWPDGVWWVELGPLTEPAQVAELVATTIGALVEPARAPVSALAPQLRERRILLCLDNCEHVLDGVVELTTALLRECPDVSMLTTSREPLGVPAEAVWRVPSLPDDEAVVLFFERASLVRPWFTLDESSESAVRTMCTRLDGIPLALELAAAWLSTLTPQQIEAELDDRFALLVKGLRGAVGRHQTLAASIAWSHDLLDETDQVVFRRLAGFAGGFTLDAARAVVAGEAIHRDDVLGAIGRLVDKSLVMVEEHDGQTRYRLLETIRRYAADRLDRVAETDAVRERHLDYFLSVAEAAEPLLDEAKDAWWERLGAERDNLRAALEWGLGLDDPGRGRRLAAALWWLWNHGGRGHEGIAFLKRAIDRVPDDRSVLQARLLVGAAQIADTTTPFDLNPAQQGLEIATENGDERLRGVCLQLLAVGSFYADFDAGWQLCQESKRAAELVGDGFVLDGAHALHGIIEHLRDRHDEARTLLERSVPGFVERGDRGIAATVYVFLSDTALRVGETDLARELAERAVRIAEPLRDYHRVGSARSQRALVYGVSGAVDEGLRSLEPFLRLVEDAGTDVFVPGMARIVGTLRLWDGDLEQAAAWLERDAGSTPETYLTALARPLFGAALARLGRTDQATDELASASTLARQLGMPRVLADTMEQQAWLAIRADDTERAAGLLHEALTIRVEHGLRASYPDSLDGLAWLLAHGGRHADAARVLAASDAARKAMGCPRQPVERPAYDTLIGKLRAALGEDGFSDASEGGARMPLNEAVAYVRRSRGTRGRPSTGWDSLTPTELEVAKLVAEGLTNPEIGGRLFMSRGTVKTHLSHVYAKLGIANRAELAAIAAARP